MLIVKSLHIIAMVAWFAGLFYLPRLFVYHADASDYISIERFKLMERKLYYAITWPAGVLTTGFGIWLLSYNLSYYKIAMWMHVKLSLVVLLWVFHLSCGYFLKQFAKDKVTNKGVFFRYFNEIPTLLLIGIVVLVIVKPGINL